MQFGGGRFWDRYELEIHTCCFDLTVWVYRPSYRWRELKRAWKSFYGPCPDCGKKFGRHDEDVEHFPF